MSDNVLTTRIVLRNATADEWAEKNPTPANAEICLETDTGKYKVGDGVNNWENLVYYVHIDDTKNNYIDTLIGMLNNDEFGKVDDVQVNGESIVNEKIANVVIATLTFSDVSQDTSEQSVTQESVTLHKVSRTGEYSDLLNTPEIIDNLDSTSTTDTLSANQGHVLKDMVQAIPFATAYSNIETMISALNSAQNDKFNIGASLFIQTLDVPDFWVYFVADESIAYTYTSDQDLIDAINTTGYVQIGYYQISKLETQKVDLTDYVTQEMLSSEITTINNSLSNLDTKIDSEISRASDVETDLQSQIKSNDDDISILQSNLSAETERATTAEKTLQDNLDSEIDRATRAETTLQDNITAEETRATGVESDLQGQITSNDTDISNLQSDLATEIDRATTSESSLQTSIDSLNSTSGSSLSVSIDTETYVMTINLLNSDGDTLSTGTIDLPLESVVVSGEYDVETKMIILTLESGSTTEFSIASLIDGLVSESDFNDLALRVETNESNISTNTTAIGNLETALESKADSSDIPTSTSQLTNDSGYITKAVSDLTNYYLKSETYTQDEIDEMVSAIPKFAIEVVDDLPTEDISETTVYLLKSGDDDTNLYTEYIYVNSAWEKLGSQTVDLEGYVTTAELTTTLSDYAKSDDIPTGIIADGLDDTTSSSRVGYATTATTATTATKLGSSTVGSSTNPIYLSSGIPTACNFNVSASLSGGMVYWDSTNKALATGTSSIILNDGVHNRTILSIYDDGDSYNYGSELVLCANGNTFVGSGESTSALRTEFQTNGTASGESYSTAGEQLYLTSDNNIYLYSGTSNDATTRTGIVYDPSGYLRPLVTGTRQLGSSSYYWNAAYINTIYGDLSGTASKATADGDGNTISSYYVTLSTSQTISGTKTFSANPYIMRGNPYLYLKDSSYAKATAPSSTQWRGISFSDKSGYRFVQMEHSYATDMSTNFYVRNYRATTAESYTNYGQAYLQLNTSSSDYGSACLYAYNASGTLYGATLESSTTSFRPDSTGTISLGTSSYKWKNLYLSGNLSDGTNSVAVSEIEKRVLIYSVSTPNTSTVINLTDLGISIGDTIEVELQLMNGTSEVNYTGTKYLVRTTISSQSYQYFRDVSVTYMTLNSSSTDSSGNAVGDGYIYNFPCETAIDCYTEIIYLYPNFTTLCKRLSYSTSTGKITRYDSSDYKWAINKVYKIG